MEGFELVREVEVNGVQVEPPPGALGKARAFAHVTVDVVRDELDDARCVLFPTVTTSTMSRPIHP